MDFLYLKDKLVSYTQTIRLNHLMTCGMVGESPYLLAVLVYRFTGAEPV